MSDQHEQDQEHEVVPVEVYRDPADEGAPAEADTQPPEGEHFTTSSTEHTAPDEADEQPEADDHGVDGGEAASDSSDPAVPVDERATPNDLQAERYERAKLDPEFAVQQAIDVPEDERGPAWEAGSLAEHARTSALEAQAADDDDTDEEV